MSQPVKIVCIVSRGVVSEVHCSVPAKVQIVDLDNDEGRDDGVCPDCGQDFGQDEAALLSHLGSSECPCDALDKLLAEYQQVY